MKWLTNCGAEDVERIKFELLVGNAGRKIHTGEPKGTEWLTVEDLKSVDMVGLYEEE